MANTPVTESLGWLGPYAADPALGNMLTGASVAVGILNLANAQQEAQWRSAVDEALKGILHRLDYLIQEVAEVKEMIAALPAKVDVLLKDMEEGRLSGRIFALDIVLAQLDNSEKPTVADCTDISEAALGIMEAAATLRKKWGLAAYPAIFGATLAAEKAYVYLLRSAQAKKYRGGLQFILEEYVRYASAALNPNVQNSPAQVLSSFVAERTAIENSVKSVAGKKVLLVYLVDGTGTPNYASYTLPIEGAQGGPTFESKDWDHGPVNGLNDPNFVQYAYVPPAAQNWLATHGGGDFHINSYDRWKEVTQVLRSNDARWQNLVNNWGQAVAQHITNIECTVSQVTAALDALKANNVEPLHTMKAPTALIDASGKMRKALPATLHATL